jgi:membrane protein required for colicin V production
MLLDIIALILLVVALYKGLSKGLIVALFSFLSFFIGLAAALKLSVLVARNLGEHVNVSERWLPVIAFILVFLLVVFLVRLGAKGLEKIFQVSLLGWVNRLGGFFFYLLIYLFVFSILIFYADAIHILSESAKENSVAYSFLHPLAPGMIRMLGYIFPFFQDMFAELSRFFGEIADNGKIMLHD